LCTTLLIPESELDPSRDEEWADLQQLFQRAVARASGAVDAATRITSRWPEN
jgi:hypothetical protein